MSRSPDPSSHPRPLREDGDRRLLGIDPGFDGALVTLVARASGRLLLDRIVDMPVVQVSTGSRKRIDEAALYLSLEELAWGSSIVLEKVWGMKGQGAGSAFNFGEGYGLIRGMLTALAHYSPEHYGGHDLVAPQTWQKAMVVGEKGKGASVLAARRLVPESAPFLELKKHHGRADAILLAAYLERRRAKP